jgi:chromosome segregation ATPase
LALTQLVLSALVYALTENIEVTLIGGIVSIIVAGLALVGVLATRENKKNAKVASVSAVKAERSAKRAEVDRQIIEGQKDLIETLRVEVRALRETVSELQERLGPCEDCFERLEELEETGEIARTLEKGLIERLEALEARLSA